MTKSGLMEFADKVLEISRTFMKYYADGAYRVKLTLSQIAILDILSRTKGSKMSDLARYMNVSTAAITGIIDRLARDGYVARTDDPKDRRVINIRLRGKGLSAVKYLLEQKRRMISRIFGVLSEKERKEYLNILMRIQDGLKS